MFRKLFSSRNAAAGLPKGAIPPGTRVYAVGDIHGRLDLLEALLAQIAADDAARPDSDTMLLFLGDLIDRGPQSAQVVERLRQLKADGANIRLLLGNHEEVFLTALSGDEKALKFFNRIGGRETILSYGISADEYNNLDYPDLLALLIARVPPQHREFIEGFEDLIILGDFAFVHAGVRPDSPLGLQKASDLRWIRNDFTQFRGKLEKVVVHGHTITEDVVEQEHRIGLDTGAYSSGKLTAMGFEGSERWLLQT